MTGRTEIDTELTDSERELLSRRLWELMGKQTARYTAFDSSSVPVATARELFASLCFTLGEHLDSEGLADRALLSGDMSKMLEKGREAIAEKTARGKKLWLSVCNSAPEVQSASYRETLTELGAFFGRYDPYYFARSIPCEIDYQLCVPVSEKLEGINYVNAYLEELYVENRIMDMYDAEKAEALESAAYGAWKDTVLNLCEPILYNSLALCLCGKTPFGLSVGGEERQRLVSILEPMPKDMFDAELRGAALRLAEALEIADMFGINMIMSTAQALCPRLREAVYNGVTDKLLPEL